MDELEQRINQCHTKGMEDEEDYERASKALGAAANKARKSVTTPAGKIVTLHWRSLIVVLAIGCRKYAVLKADYRW